MKERERIRPGQSNLIINVFKSSIPIGKSGISPEEMDYILETEHGVIFLETKPKKAFNIGEFSLASLFGYENLEIANIFANRTIRFYQGTPIMDKWEPNHEARKKWRQMMNLKYGAVFKERYEDRNQFRVNNMTAMIGWLGHMVICAQKSGSEELSKQLASIQKIMLYPKNGQKIAVGYTFCESISEKLEFVNILADQAEATLDLLNTF